MSAKTFSDFNGDSKADILWRDPVTGSNAMWLMDGNTLSSPSFITSASTNWQVQGTGDFNGDSKADILWRDPATGSNAMWLMDGNTLSSPSFITSASTNWQVVG